MISNKKFYQIMAIIIFGASIAVGTKSGSFLTASISTFVGIVVLFIFGGLMYQAAVFCIRRKRSNADVWAGGGEER